MPESHSDAFLNRTSLVGDEQADYGEAHAADPSETTAVVSVAPEPRVVLPVLDGPYAKARRQAIIAFERAYVQAVLARTAGNVSQAARIAQIDRVYLHRLIRRLDLPRGLFRDLADS